MSLLVRDAVLCDPGSPPETGSCRLEGGMVTEVGALEPRVGEETLSADGLWLVPALVDLHVHLRVPGQEDREDLDTGCAALWNGGTAAAVAMPNTVPPLEGPGLIAAQREEAASLGVDLRAACAATAGREGLVASPHLAANFAAGCPFATDDGASVPDTATLREVLAAIRGGGGHLCHSEDPALSRGAAHHLPDPDLGPAGDLGHPRMAEDVMVARDAVMGLGMGVRTHLTHVSSRVSVALIRALKPLAGGILTADTTYHHLLVAPAEVAADPVRWKVNPPIREEADREALWEGVLDGAFDALVTDHAPHGDLKERADAAGAPFGLSSADMTFSLLSTLAAERGVGLETLLPLATSAPALLGGFEGRGRLTPGAVGDLLLVDPDEVWTPAEGDCLSKGRNVPWLGRALTGRVRGRIRAGRPVGRNGR